MKEKEIKEKVKAKYSKEEEIWNTITHSIGALGTLVVCSIFAVQVYEKGNGLDLLSIILMLVGVSISYIFSAVYHRKPNTNPVKRVLRKFDHASIFWHIAACYSPITLIAFLRGGEIYLGWGMFVFCWLFAAVGSAMLLRKVKDKSILETAIYVLMGLTIVFAIKNFYDIVGFDTVMWVILEGVAYITGAVLYCVHKVKYMHSVFHVFIMLGDAFHFVAVGKIISSML
jgi:hemolysin III